jgi:hypothetical protein
MSMTERLRLLQRYSQMPLPGIVYGPESWQNTHPRTEGVHDALPPHDEFSAGVAQQVEQLTCNQ